MAKSLKKETIKTDETVKIVDDENKADETVKVLDEENKADETVKIVDDENKTDETVKVLDEENKADETVKIVDDENKADEPKGENAVVPTEKLYKYGDESKTLKEWCDLCGFVWEENKDRHALIWFEVVQVLEKR